MERRENGPWNEPVPTAEELLEIEEEREETERNRRLNRDSNLLQMVKAKYPNADIEGAYYAGRQRPGKAYKRVAYKAICEEVPGVVDYFVIAFIDLKTESKVVLCESGNP